MALTSNNIEMIKAIAQNDLHKARTAALASLAEDKSKKNAWAIDRYRKYLTANASVIAGNMPNDLKVFLSGETPDSFNPGQYYLRDKERTIYEGVRRMRLTSELLAEKCIKYKNTTLLYGKTGTGKTELGRYIAYKLNLPFFYISFSTAIDSYMGNTAKNLHKAFEFCSSIPCVFMLDEVDCISMKRASGGSKGADGELERTTISLMQELDSLPGHVVLIAATNRPDLIDDALMRRFSLREEISPMTREELAAAADLLLSSTETKEYVKEEDLDALLERCDTPGAMMPELIRMISDGIYEENREKLEKEAEAKEGEKIDLWQVTYTWQANIAAETESDAVAIARRKRSQYTYNSKDFTERYEAKRADYIYPEQQGQT